jgi:hypothetical protein
VLPKDVYVSYSRDMTSQRGSRPHYAAKPCPHCGGPHGARYCLSVDWKAEQARIDRFTKRAAAHALADPRAAQRWQNQVTDEDVAALLYAIEAGDFQPYRIRSGRWVAPMGQHVAAMRHDLSTVINEAIRTGLVRHVIQWQVDYLVPALVHLRDGDWSACRFTGEDMGPMRARLVDDLTLVDCLECEAVVSRGHARGL